MANLSEMGIQVVESEEGEDAPGTSEIIWVCDPIDGSASLVHGGGSWAISLAATYHGESLAGVVSDVEADETYVAKLGGGANLNGRPIHVSAAATLAESVIATDFAHDRALRASQAEVLGRVASRARAMRNVGSTVLHLCWVASGRLDGMWQTTGKCWDVAAAGLCVTEAGGVLSDLDGGPMRPEAVVACAPEIHRELIDAVAI
jgi:myo-inositol-1(or 4)-monophosphatase